MKEQGCLGRVSLSMDASTVVIPLLPYRSGGMMEGWPRRGPYMRHISKRLLLQLRSETGCLKKFSYKLFWVHKKYIRLSSN